MAYSTLENFKSEVMARNLAKPNRFEVLIHPPAAFKDYNNNVSETSVQNSKLASLFCESANLPTKTIGVKQQRIQGPAYQRPTSVDYGGEGLSMTFLVDQQMVVKSFFDYWMEKVVSPYSYTINYQDEYASRINIYQLNEKNERVYGVLLFDAFPRSIAQMELNHGTQNQVHKLTVTFAYRYWEASALSNSFIPKTATVNNPSNLFDIFKRSSVTDEMLRDINYTRIPLAK
jgi:hypothetical protein